MEVWKDIPSLPEYEASSWGRIKCKPYISPMPYGGFRTYGGKAWRGVWDGRRYIFSFRHKSYRVARMVCEAFNGSALYDKSNCLHGNEDSRNNRPGNLYWGTQKENLNAPGFLEYCRGRTGEDNPYVKGRRASL